MDQAYQRFLVAGDADRVVDALSRQQFTKPHQSVADAIDAVVGHLGVCPEAARVAADALDVDRESAVGRLRRTELMQLARAIHRFWRHSVVDNSPPSQPS
jgi:hypothetical protein